MYCQEDHYGENTGSSKQISRRLKDLEIFSQRAISLAKRVLALKLHFLHGYSTRSGTSRRAGSRLGPSPSTTIEAKSALPIGTGLAELDPPLVGRLPTRVAVLSARPRCYTYLFLLMRRLLKVSTENYIKREVDWRLNCNRSIKTFKALIVSILPCAVSIATTIWSPILKLRCIGTVPGWRNRRVKQWTREMHSKLRHVTTLR